MKRLLILILALVLATTCFVSCAPKAEDDLDRITKAGKIVVGMEVAYAPYNWAEANANSYTVKVSNGAYADGYDVQIAKAIAAGLGVELEIKAIEWDGLIPAYWYKYQSEK